MVHILLLILKIIGIILLSILMLALIILLYPITYIGKISSQLENKEIQAKVRFGWLFYLIYAGLWLEDGEIKYSLRVLGIPIISWKKKDRKKTNSSKKENINKNETDTDTEDEFIKNSTFNNRDETSEVKHTETDIEAEKKASKADTAKKQTFCEKYKKTKKNLKQKIDNICENVKNKKETTKEKIKRLCDMIKGKQQSAKSVFKKIKEIKIFITKNSTKEAYRYGKKLVLGLLRYLSPNRVKGSVKFGFEEPYMTGEALGYIGMAYGMFNINPKKMEVFPDFEQKAFEGKIIFKGHFCLGIVLIYCLKFYFNKNINYIIKKFR